MSDHVKAPSLERIDGNRSVDTVIPTVLSWKRTTNTLIEIAIDSVPSDQRSGWNAGIYTILYYEPSIIPEQLQKKNSLTDDVRVTGIHHGPGSPDDMLTMAYLEAMEYLRYTLDMIARFPDRNRLSVQAIRCICCSPRWMNQFSNLGNTVNVDPIPESALPMSLVVHVMTELIARFNIVFTFELLDRADFEHERKRYDGKDK